MRPHVPPSSTGSAFRVPSKDAKGDDTFCDYPDRDVRTTAVTLPLVPEGALALAGRRRLGLVSTASNASRLRMDPFSLLPSRFRRRARGFRPAVGLDEESRRLPFPRLRRLPPGFR